jgi:AraC-like DNA-binding protein
MELRTEIQVSYQSSTTNFPEFSVENGPACDKSKKFLELLNQTFRDHLSNTSFDLDGAASDMGMSRRSIQRWLGQSTGMTFSTALRLFRLTYAKSLLSQGQSIREISAISGFSSASYFSASFRREFDLTPLEYRRNSMQSENNN